MEEAAMNRAGLILAVLTALVCGCQHERTVAKPGDVSAVAPIGSAVTAVADSQAAADKLRADRDSKLAASIEVIGRQNAAAPASPQQIVIAAEQTFAAKVLNVTPSAEDRAAAAERESLLASGRAEEARRLYAEASAKADDLNSRITKATAERDAAIAAARDAVTAAAAKLAEQQAKHDADMAALRAQHQRDLAAARSAADAKARLFQVLIFSGLGAACILGAVAIRALKAYVPAFGAQAAIWLGGAGLALVLTGVLVRAIERLIDDHPFIFWGGVAAAATAAAVAIGLVIANHHHAKTAPAAPVQPMP
jgi:hypothetical protein